MFGGQYSLLLMVKLETGLGDGMWRPCDTQTTLLVLSAGPTINTLGDGLAAGFSEKSMLTAN